MQNVNSVGAERVDVRADVVPNTGVIRGCDARLGKAQSWPTFVCMTSACIIIDLSAVPVPVPRVDWGLGTILFQDLVSISCSHSQNVLYTAFKWLAQPSVHACVYFLMFEACSAIEFFRYVDIAPMMLCFLGAHVPNLLNISN